ncbi:MAG: hydroxymethylbilane synthase [Nakamurella sp.]
MTDPVLRIGTRGSALALAQSGAVGARLVENGRGEVDLVRVKTEGDINTGPLAAIGGTGVFVTAVRTALLDGRVDVIVHSFKDLPTAPAPGLALAAVPERESPFDALCARDGLTLASLPNGARIGTGSPRRVAQILLHRPDLVVVPVRGNVDTRLRMVSSSELDAVVLAVAGLTRLGRTGEITEVFGPDIMLPAPAQGALAVECRDADVNTAWFAGALESLDQPAARAAAAAERSLLATLEAGCIAPVGAYATVVDGSLRLRGAVIAVDGSESIAGESSGPVDDAAAVGKDLAAELLSRGATVLLGAAR